MNFDRDKLNEGVLAWLRANTGRKVGLGDVPADREAGKGYVILYPGIATSGTGSMANPEEDHGFMFQATCVGRDYRETARISSTVNKVFTGRGPNNGWLYDLVITGINIQDRRTEQLGAILPSGPDLFASNDMYRIQAGV